MTGIHDAIAAVVLEPKAVDDAIELVGVVEPAHHDDVLRSRGPHRVQHGLHARRFEAFELFLLLCRKESRLVFLDAFADESPSRQTSQLITVWFVHQVKQNGRMVLIPRCGILPKLEKLRLRRPVLMEVEDDICAAIGREHNDLIDELPIGLAPVIRILQAEPIVVLYRQTQHIGFPVFDRLDRGALHLLTARIPFHARNIHPLQPDLLALRVHKPVAPRP